jgi:hypothetical protein
MVTAYSQTTIGTWLPKASIPQEKTQTTPTEAVKSKSQSASLGGFFPPFQPLTHAQITLSPHALVSPTSTQDVQKETTEKQRRTFANDARRTLAKEGWGDVLFETLKPQLTTAYDADKKLDLAQVRRLISTLTDNLPQDLLINGKAPKFHKEGYRQIFEDTLFEAVVTRLSRHNPTQEFRTALNSGLADRLYFDNYDCLVKDVYNSNGELNAKRLQERIYEIVSTLPADITSRLPDLNTVGYRDLFTDLLSTHFKKQLQQQQRTPKRENALSTYDKQKTKAVDKFVNKLKTADLESIFSAIPRKEPDGLIAHNDIVRAVDAQLSKYLAKAESSIGKKLTSESEFRVYFKEQLISTVIRKLAKQGSLKVVYENSDYLKKETSLPANMLRNLDYKNRHVFSQLPIQVQDSHGKAISYDSIMQERFRIYDKLHHHRFENESESNTTSGTHRRNTPTSFHETSMGQVITLRTDLRTDELLRQNWLDMIRQTEFQVN